MDAEKLDKLFEDSLNYFEQFHACLKDISIYIILLFFAMKIFHSSFIHIIIERGFLTITRRRQYRKKPNAEDFIYNVEDCPICLDFFCEPIRLQCGHVYCLKCITIYCELDPEFKCKCPLCRDLIVEIYHIEGYGKSLSVKEKKKLGNKLHSIIVYRNSLYYQVMGKVFLGLKWVGFGLMVLTVFVYFYNKLHTRYVFFKRLLKQD